jgi:hypothetical protein
MSNHFPKIPLTVQYPGLAKAIGENPSYESFRENVIHPANYSNMEGRPSTHGMSRIRRYPNGRLDFVWAANLVINAVKQAEKNEPMTDLEESFLTVLFPVKFSKKEPAQAEINTQLSSGEKEHLREYVTAHFAEELSYNAGQGGGSVPGRTRTLSE